MKQLLINILIIAFLATTEKAQPIQFAIFSSPGTNNQELLRNNLQQISSLNEIEFALILGNLTAHGTKNEFSELRNLIGKSKIPVYMLPGKSDINSNLHSELNFIEAFGDSRFSIVRDSILICGIKTAQIYSGGNPHISIEERNWLKELLTNKIKHCLLFLNDAPEQVININSLFDVLIEREIKLIIATEFTSKLSGNYTVEISSLKKYLINKFSINDSALETFAGKDFFNLKKVSTTEFIIPGTELVESEITESKIVWERNLNYTVAAKPVITIDKIFVCDKLGLLYSFDLKGKQIWQNDLFGDVITSGVYADNFYAAATLQGDLSTLNASTGNLIQTIGFNQAITSNLLSYNYTGSKRLMIPKTTKSNAVILVGTESGEVFSLDFETLEQIWKNNSSKSAITGNPIYRNDKIFFANINDEVYCVDAKEGWLIWKWAADSKKSKENLSNSLLAAENEILFTANDGSIYSLDANLGKVKWKNNNLKSSSGFSISADNKTLYVKSIEDKFHFVNVSNGKLIKTISMRYGIDKSNSSSIEGTNIIIVPASNGRVYRINSEYLYKTIFISENDPIISINQVSSEIDNYIITTADGNIYKIHFKEE